MPQEGDLRHSTHSLEVKGNHGYHKRDASNMELFMNGTESDRKAKEGVNDEFELQFDDLQRCRDDGCRTRPREDRGAQLAFETN